jgi:hypothetical protein
MADRDMKKPLPEGYEMVDGRFQPRRVQGGWVPRASGAPITPPKGGSLAKPPPKK